MKNIIKNQINEKISLSLLKSRLFSNKKINLFTCCLVTMIRNLLIYFSLMLGIIRRFTSVWPKYHWLISCWYIKFLRHKLIPPFSLYLQGYLKSYYSTIIRKKQICYNIKFMQKNIDFYNNMF